MGIRIISINKKDGIIEIDFNSIRNNIVLISKRNLDRFNYFHNKEIQILDLGRNKKYYVEDISYNYINYIEANCIILIPKHEHFLFGDTLVNIYPIVPKIEFSLTKIVRHHLHSKNIKKIFYPIRILDLLKDYTNYCLSFSPLIIDNTEYKIVVV